MRRAAVLIAVAASIAGSVLLAAPQTDAATLKPGVPTAVKSAPIFHTTLPVQTGNVVVYWKAPKVVPGHTAKATAYRVTCGSKKVTTTKTGVIVKAVAKTPTSVTCSVVAVAGKATSATVKARPLSVYTARGAVLVTGIKAFSLHGTAPVVGNGGGALIPLSDDPYTTNADAIGTYGSVMVNGTALSHITLSNDPAATASNPIGELSGTDSTGNTVYFGHAMNLNQNTGFFTLYAPNDTPSLEWYAMQGVTIAAPGIVLGQIAVVGQSDL